MEHYADHCASCHANDGSGDTNLDQILGGPSPYPRVADGRRNDMKQHRETLSTAADERRQTLILSRPKPKPFSNLARRLLTWTAVPVFCLRIPCRNLRRRSAVLWSHAVVERSHESGRSERHRCPQRSVFGALWRRFGLASGWPLSTGDRKWPAIIFNRGGNGELGSIMDNGQACVGMNDVHPLPHNRDDRNRLIVDWFNRFGSDAQ